MSTVSLYLGDAGRRSPCKRLPRIAQVALLVLFCSGCAAAIKTRVLTPPHDIGPIKQLVLRPVQIESTALNRHSIKINQQVKLWAVRELQMMLRAKNIVPVSVADWDIRCHIVIAYSERAAPNSPDADVGAGRFQVTLELKDRSGVRYATVTEVDVASLDPTVSEDAAAAIHKAVADFGSRLDD